MTVDDLQTAVEYLASTTDVVFKIVQGSGDDLHVTRLYPSRVHMDACGELALEVDYLEIRVRPEDRA